MCVPIAVDRFKDTVASKNFAFTTLWLAPEVITQDKYNHKSDVWSLACIVIEMVSIQLSALNFLYFGALFVVALVEARRVHFSLAGIRSFHVPLFVS